jgi:hypothetical protein
VNGRISAKFSGLEKKGVVGGGLPREIAFEGQIDVGVVLFNKIAYTVSPRRRKVRCVWDERTWTSFTTQILVSRNMSWIAER